MSQDECSFVSLRDVERAMIVFKFFTEKMSLFAEHIASKAAAEVRRSHSATIPLYILSLTFSHVGWLQDSTARCPNVVTCVVTWYLLSHKTSRQGRV